MYSQFYVKKCISVLMTSFQVTGLNNCADVICILLFMYSIKTRDIKLYLVYIKYVYCK